MSFIANSLHASVCSFLNFFFRVACAMSYLFLALTIVSIFSLTFSIPKISHAFRIFRLIVAILLISLGSKSGIFSVCMHACTHNSYYEQHSEGSTFKNEKNDHLHLAFNDDSSGNRGSSY